MTTAGEMTVIVVGTDQLSRITETLGSLIAQTDRPLTVVVGDHGSQDQTGQVLSQLPSHTQFLQIRSISFPRSLPRAAVMNRLFRATTTSIVVLVRPGTRLNPQWASRMGEAAQDGVVAVAYTEAESTPRMTSSGIRRGWPDVIALSRAVLEAVGGWDPRVSAPVGQRRWWAVLAGGAWPMVIVPQVVASAPIDGNDADGGEGLTPGRILPWGPCIQSAQDAPAAFGYPPWGDSETFLVLGLAHKAGAVAKQGMNRVVWLVDPETDGVLHCRQLTERVARAIGRGVKIDLWEESYPWETFLSRAASPQNLWMALGHSLDPLFVDYLERFDVPVLVQGYQGGDR